MSLNVEAITVESFATTSAMAPGSDFAGTGTEYPNCIVYVSDCVSCPMEP